MEAITRPAAAWLVAALLLVAVAARSPAQWQAPVVPAPEPFSLGSYDAIDAVWMLRRVRFLQWWDGQTRPQIVAVRTVESVWVGYDPDAYDGHQNRYDILLNGEPLEWDRLYIEYHNDMVNLRLLFTYRNQQPAPDLPYRLRWP